MVAYELISIIGFGQTAISKFTEMSWAVIYINDLKIREEDEPEFIRAMELGLLWFVTMFSLGLVVEIRFVSMMDFGFICFH